MRLSQKADYAVRMMVDLASLPDGQRTTVSEVANRQDVPLAFMAKIVAQLAAVGLVETRRGNGGWVALGRKARDITFLQIVEAVDGLIAFTRCTFEPTRCPRSGRCAVHSVWEKAQYQLRELLANTLLSDIAIAQKALATILA